MAPRVEGPHITAFYANGTASDAVYGPGDHLTLRFSRATDRAPALLVAGSLPQAAVPRLLACKVDVGGEERAVPLGAVTGEWLADDLLQLTVQGTAGAAPALLVRGAPSAVGVGVLKCCVLKAANLMDKGGLSLPVDSCSAVLEGDWGSLPGPGVASVGLSDAHGVTAAIDSGGTIAITFEADTDMGGTPLGWTVSHAALEAGLRWGGAASGAPPYSDTAPPYSAAEARWTDNRTLTLTVLAPLAPDANASAPPPPAACGGGLSVTVLPALGVRDPAQLSLASDGAAVALGSGAGCEAGGADGLYAWGNAVHQALGVTEASKCPQLRSVVAEPHPVDSPIFKGAQVAALAAANHFSVALLANGSTFAWGSDLLGAASVPSPQAVCGGGVCGGGAVASLSAGWEHALLLMDDGSLRGFGSDTHGQLGGINVSAVPQLLVGLPSARLMATGAQHSLVVAADGGVYTFGLNDAAQLGPAAAAAAADTYAPRKVPTRLAAGWLAGGRVVALAAGRYHSLALLSDGAVCAWGSNARGQLGDNSSLGATTASRTAAPCFNLSDFAPAAAPAVAIIAGDEHSMAITRDGELFAWGKGTAALGVADDVATPTRVPLPSALGAAAGGGAFVRSAAGGASHSLATTASGEVWAWGAHGVGQLGAGCDALGGAAARPPTLVESPMRGTLSAWRTVAGHGLETGAPLATLDLGAAPPSPAAPPASPPGSTPLWLSSPSAHGGADAVATACRAACEADTRCHAFEMTLPLPPASGVVSSGDCTFFDGSAADVFASAVLRPNATLHLFEKGVSVGGATLVAAGGEHSLAAAGRDHAGRCPATGDAQAECGGAARGTCAWTECRCLAPWLGDGCTSKGCGHGCAAGGHGACVLSGRDATSGAAQYACVCDAGWSGASCELPSCNELDGQPCAGHGTCEPGAAGEAHRCDCEDGWQGAACAQPQCAGTLGGCTGRGTCKCLRGGVLLSECAADGTEVQACECEAGWVGAACTMPCPVTASGAVCGGGEHGACGLSADAASGACTCDALWSGAACEQPLCPKPALSALLADGTSQPEGAGEECAGRSHGACAYTFDEDGGASGASCVCEPGWSAADCGAMACEDGCSGHGTCQLDGAGVPGCSCDDGWAGDDCSDGQGQRMLLIGLSIGGGCLLLLLCMCAVFRCLYAMSTGELHGPGDALMRQRWQRAHAAPGPGMLAVHVPVRGVKTRISP